MRQSVRPSAESKTSEAKSSGEKRKRKAKDASDKLKYPSVPTTAHIPSDCMYKSSSFSLCQALFLILGWVAANMTPFLVLALSSFFSLHRPISVTRGLPRNVSDDAFASIFALQTRSQRAAEVMTTISRTVEELEQPMANLSVQQQQQGGSKDGADSHHHYHQDGGIQKLDLRNTDGSQTSVTVQVNNMSGQFLPFRPPPLPRPESAAAHAEKAAALSAAEEAALEEAAQQDPQLRVYKAMFTIEETTDANGEVKIIAHSPELIEDSSEGDGSERPTTAMMSSADGARAEPRTFLGRMALRQLRYEDARGQREMMRAISVKRQRKLKMKKKKYKKLTKRQRHERLKHGRT